MTQSRSGSPRPAGAATAAPGGGELGRLHDLAVFLGTEEALDAHLGDLALLAAESVPAASCSIMLLSEGEPDRPQLRLWASSAPLPEAAWRERAGVGDAIAGRVLEQRTALVIDDIRHSEFAPLARGHQGVGASFMCVPIVLGMVVIGVMNASASNGAAPFDNTNLQRADLVAMLIGKAIQVHRLQTLLRSRIAQLTLARQEPEVAASLTDGGIPPARLAKVLAKAFYKDLAAAGFGAGQIIEAATEIIGQISGDIAKHKTRLARGRQETGRGRG